MGLFENMNLQKIVLVMAIFAFLFAVFIKTYNLMYTIDYNQSWPPVKAKCPDYWDVSEDGSYCVNTNGMNKGTPNPNYAPVTSYDNLYKSKVAACYEDTCVIPVNTFGNKKKWALKNKIVWDGVNNTSS